jgi:hypothetical protein
VVNNCTVSTDEAIREPAPRAKVAMLLAAVTYSLIGHDIASEATSADKYRDRDRDTTRAPLRGDMAMALREYRARGTRSCLSLSRSSSAPSRGPASKGLPRACVVDKIDHFAAELSGPVRVRPNDSWRSSSSCTLLAICISGSAQPTITMPAGTRSLSQSQS